MRTLILGLSALMLSYAGDSWAMRCGNQLVTTGMTRYEVRERCGEPDDVSRRFATVYRNTAADETIAVEVEIEEWFYEGGRNRLDRRLKFVNGALESEEIGNR